MAGMAHAVADAEQLILLVFAPAVAACWVLVWLLGRAMRLRVCDRATYARVRDALARECTPDMIVAPVPAHARPRGPDTSGVGE
jgi:hypothetical protein